ncbi:MAG TPA: type II toxin-antitoxin system prevent-host-death family antitoxin [Candidatus Margulisiibacteriota bacterium]|nr:type II toxin-antitoxin system prevent-host-death family antitoxin [Candidatus Margulisiibacteriota bacterium]
MPVIRPLSDLRNKPQEIVDVCRRSGEPVFITKKGVGKRVVMSVAAYERDQARLRLYELLDAAEADECRGDKGMSLKRLDAWLRTDGR